MSFFGNYRGEFGDYFNNNRIFNDKGPSIFEKIEMILTDVEIEGKKQGYERAANEYEKAYCNIEKSFLETKKLIEQEKQSYDKRAELLINKLSELEKEKIKLEKQVNDKINELSSKHDIPISNIKQSIIGSSFISYDPNSSFSIIDIIYNNKEKKLKEAEQRGYLEAKDIYENKIRKLKEELKRLKENGNRDICRLLSMIDEILESIVNEQMKIAELKILLQ